MASSVFIVEPDINRLDERSDLTEGAYVAGAAMLRVHKEVADAASHDRTLVIHGESGTGKEHIARMFHQRGPRARGPFVGWNCASFSALVESELFGHLRGAFTGAERDHVGLLEQAHGGVLFLDEVGELSLQVQAKLLRALQEREIVRLGATKPTPVDIGLCFATHRDLEALIAAGSFRADFYHRIAQRKVTLPPLRERPEEIGFLAGAFRTMRRGAPPMSDWFVEWALL